MKHFTEKQDTCPDCGSDHLTCAEDTTDGVTTCRHCEAEWTHEEVGFESVEALELDDLLAA